MRSRWFKQSATLAVRSVMRNHRRVALATSAVTFGIAALIMAGGFIEWIFWATREGTIQQGLGHIHVAKEGFRDAGQATDSFLLPPDAPALEALRERPGVRTVAPRRMFSGLVSHGDVTLSFFAEAVDPERERNFGDVSIIVRGEDLSGAKPHGVIIGQGLAANLDVNVGDTIVLLANKSNGGVDRAPR